jgi:hypothetical protein
MRRGLRQQNAVFVFFVCVPPATTCWLTIKDTRLRARTFQQLLQKEATPGDGGGMSDDVEKLLDCAVSGMQQQWLDASLGFALIGDVMDCESRLL